MAIHSSQTRVKLLEAIDGLLPRTKTSSNVTPAKADSALTHARIVRELAEAYKALGG